MNTIKSNNKMNRNTEVLKVLRLYNVSQNYEKLVLLIRLTIKHLPKRIHVPISTIGGANWWRYCKFYLKRWSKRVITIDKIIIPILGGVGV